MAQQSGSQSHETQSHETRGKVDLASVLYVFGGIPAIIGFMFLLFALGVPMCGLPA